MHGTLGTMLEEELMISTRVASYLSSLFIFSPNDSSPYFLKPKKNVSFGIDFFWQVGSLGEKFFIIYLFVIL